jgi:putative SOS response-associated peptidase YedK
MCGRFSQTHSGESVAQHFQLSTVPDIEPRHNIAPSQAISVITQSRPSGDRIHHTKTWGLIPRWSKDPAIGRRLFNARSETVAEKPSFREAFQKRRCLIVADGFYEWQSQAAQRTKQPYRIGLPTRSLFAFAGLWERWQEPETGVISYTCTILTTAANPAIVPIHHRMPVILPTDAYTEWLSPHHYNRGNLEAWLQPYTVSELEVLPVSNDLGKIQEQATSKV